LGYQIVQLGGEALDGNIHFPLMKKWEIFIVCRGQRHDSKGSNCHRDAEDKGMVPRGA
jgi:hypothetical protein